MILPRIAFVALVAVLLASFTAAQTRRLGARPATAKPAATPTPVATPQPTPAPTTASASPPIAIVNGVTISAGEIEDNVSTAMTQEQDQYFRDYYNDPAKAIREARQRAVDARLNSMLIEAEAKKRGKTSSELIETEINARVPPPSDEELKAAYDANREQIAGASLESVRADLVNFLRNQKSQQLYTAWLTRLKMTNAVSKNGDVNAPNLAAGTVLGAVNGEPLRIETINERMKAYVYKMEMRLYEMREDFLNRRINNQLINAEAEKRKVGSEEVFRVEVTDKIKPPTDAEVKRFFDENKEKISGDLEANRTFIVTILQQQQQQKLEVALVEKLRAGAKIQVMLTEPEAPVMSVSLGSGASRGDVNAAVTIVEFTDFQCPACGGMYPIVEDMLKTYGNRVHFAPSERIQSRPGCGSRQSAREVLGVHRSAFQESIFARPGFAEEVRDASWARSETLRCGTGFGQVRTAGAPRHGRGRQLRHRRDADVLHQRCDSDGVFRRGSAERYRKGIRAREAIIVRSRGAGDNALHKESIRGNLEQIISQVGKGGLPRIVNGQIPWGKKERR